MGELKAALQKQLGQLAQAQLVAQAPESNKQNGIGRVLQKIERGSSTLIEGTLARRAAERSIAKPGLLGLFCGCR